MHQPAIWLLSDPRYFPMQKSNEAGNAASNVELLHKNSVHVLAFIAKLPLKHR
jgi:hypothetical protein